jgi:hypothetical protein
MILKGCANLSAYALIIDILSWLRHCATGRKVMGSFPDEITGFFN